MVLLETKIAIFGMNKKLSNDRNRFKLILLSGSKADHGYFEKTRVWSAARHDVR